MDPLAIVRRVSAVGFRPLWWSSRKLRCVGDQRSFKLMQNGDLSVSLSFQHPGSVIAFLTAKGPRKKKKSGAEASCIPVAKEKLFIGS